MALINPVAAGETDLGTLTADTVYTCKKGMVGITTDSGSGEDMFDLAVGERLVILSGNGVKIRPRKTGSILHHMPI